ncbi:conserved hypothetical protein [Frankia canadensis]|uniref:Uncharacterized protein n=1 Tax=Frankia canadensis TaxID=1836972 RepID=A0A2I2KM50_9ACTN|nr:hypothetical protein [Frankia canadensis]SNQ46747.1 conserved hypothetical protein [Frankia canadensis]SOU54037.1 conserved hypothetical protein [Frankia canadensis]
MTSPHLAEELDRTGDDRRGGRLRIAALVATAFGAGVAAAGLARARRRPGSDVTHREESFPTTVPDASAILAGADPTDAVSPLRFGERSGPVATEDAPKPPDEGLVANTSFANEIRNDAPAHPAAF